VHCPIKSSTNKEKIDAPPYANIGKRSYGYKAREVKGKVKEGKRN
jgi:hypothetical protein